MKFTEVETPLEKIFKKCTLEDTNAKNDTKELNSLVCVSTMQNETKNSAASGSDHLCETPQCQVEYNNRSEMRRQFRRDVIEHTRRILGIKRDPNRRHKLFKLNRPVVKFTTGHIPKQGTMELDENGNFVLKTRDRKMF